MKCKLCAGEVVNSDIKPRDSEEFFVVTCSECGCVQLDHFPDYESDKAFYDSNSQAQWVENIDLMAIENKLRDDTIRRADFLAGIVPENGIIADIGTGYGFLIKEMMERGYQIDGYEIGDSRRKLAEKITGQEIFSNNILQENIELNSEYDCITLFQVLEHISEPTLFLRKLFKALKPGGKLIIEVPNYSDWLIKENEAYRKFYYQRAHLFYYDKKSLSKLFQLENFSKYEFIFIQRYSIKNAYNWLINSKPQIANPDHYEQGLQADIDQAYKKIIKGKEMTDTLITIIER